MVKGKQAFSFCWCSHVNGGVVYHSHQPNKNLLSDNLSLSLSLNEHLVTFSCNLLDYAYMFKMVDYKFRNS
jgi:hypothetical protein